MKNAKKTTKARGLRSALALLLAFVFVLGVVPAGIFADSGNRDSADGEPTRGDTVTGGYYNYNGTKVNIAGVTQGEDETNFTENLPIATIFVDETVVNATPEAREAAIPEILADDRYPGILSTGYNGKMLMLETNPTANVGEDYLGSNYLNIDITKLFEQLEVTWENLYGQEIVLEGDIIKYTYKNGAMTLDENMEFKPLDAVLTYSNITLTYENPTYLTEANFNTFMSRDPWLSVCSGNTVAIAYNWPANQTDELRTGVRVDVNIKIVDPDTGEVVNGSFYYPMQDLDVGKATSNKYARIYNSDKYQNFSEAILLKNGFTSDLFIPGSKYRAGSADITPYKSTIVLEGGKHLVYASNTDLNTFYSGFVVLAKNNPGGIDLNWRGACGHAKNAIATNLLNAFPHINHKLKATSGIGGSIATTNVGNRNGTKSGELTNGEKINVPLVSTATGQTVCYTMTPKSGYRLSKIYVHRGSVDYTKGVDITDPNYTPEDYNGDGTPDQYVYTPVDDNKDGIIDYYTFTFTDIAEDNSIHVEWEPSKLVVKKTIEGANGEELHANYGFTFRLEMDPGQYRPNNVYKVRAWSKGESMTTDYYRFSTIAWDTREEEFYMYDPINRCFIGWDAENGSWKTFPVTDFQTPLVDPDLTGFAWICKDVPKTEGDGESVDIVIYNVVTSTDDAGETTTTLVPLIRDEQTNVLSVGEIGDDENKTYFQPIIGEPHCIRWDAENSTYTYVFEENAYHIEVDDDGVETTVYDDDWIRPAFYKASVDKLTHSDNRTFINISKVKTGLLNSSGKTAKFTRVVTGKNDAFHIELPASTTFNNTVFSEILTAGKIKFAGCEVIDVFNKSGVPESVAAWNAANPQQTLKLVPNENKEVYPYVYEFNLSCPSTDPETEFPQKINLSAIVPFQWNYKVYEVDADKNPVEIGDTFSHDAKMYHEWQLDGIEVAGNAVNAAANAKGAMNDPLSNHNIHFKNIVAPVKEYFVYDFSNQLTHVPAQPEGNKPYEVIPDDPEQEPELVVPEDVEISILTLAEEPVKGEVPEADYESELSCEAGFDLNIENDNLNVKVRNITGDITEAYALVRMDPEANEGFEYEWRQIVLIPATNVHYEESYLYYNSDSNKNYAADWNGEVESDEGAINPVYDVSEGKMIGGGADRQSSENTLYGYDATYADQTGDSNGRSKHVKIGQAQFDAVKNQGKAWPETKFTFTGTGFDIIGRTGLNTGVYVVSVKNSAETTVKSQIVNSRYFGSTWMGENGDNGNIGDDLRQVPIIHISDLEHDAYTVTVQFVWMKGQAALLKKGMIDFPGIPKAEYELIGFDGEDTKAGYTYPDYDIYVDAIRIYNPIADYTAVGGVVEAAYTEALEQNPVYTEIRDILISAGSMNGGYDGIAGAVAIDATPHQVPKLDDEGKPIIGPDGKPVMEFVMPQEGFSATDFTNYGPNNEIYLTNGQAIAFKLDDPDCKQLHISAKAPYGAAEMQIVVAKANDDGGYTLIGEDAEPIAINTATEMYYKVDADFGSECYIIIKAGSTSGILSICQLKTVSFHTEDEGENDGDGEVNANIVADNTALELAVALAAGTKGDVNADGSIDMIDAILTMRAALGGDTLGVYGTYCADMNNDGCADMQDALKIIRTALAN